MAACKGLHKDKPLATSALSSYQREILERGPPKEGRADIILARICGWVKIFEATEIGKGNIFRPKICILVKILVRDRRRADIILAGICDQFL